MKDLPITLKLSRREKEREGYTYCKREIIDERERERENARAREREKEKVRERKKEREREREVITNYFIKTITK